MTFPFVWHKIHGSFCKSVQNVTGCSYTSWNLCNSMFKFTKHVIIIGFSQDLSIRKTDTSQITITTHTWTDYETGTKMETLLFQKDKDGNYECSICGAKPGELGHWTYKDKNNICNITSNIFFIFIILFVFKFSSKCPTFFKKWLYILREMTHVIFGNMRTFDNQFSSFKVGTFQLYHWVKSPAPVLLSMPPQL